MSCKRRPLSKKHDMGRLNLTTIDKQLSANMTNAKTTCIPDDIESEE